jgi:Bacterial SCP ortholog
VPRQLKPADPSEVADALDRVRAGSPGAPGSPAPDDLRLLVKHYLALLSAAAPGRSVEVRVPPYAAVQCVPGPRHTRGTPPGVVETDPLTWIQLATGALAWSDAAGDGRLIASGERTDLSPYLPL